MSESRQAILLAPGTLFSADFADPFTLGGYNLTILDAESARRATDSPSAEAVVDGSGVTEPGLFILGDGIFLTGSDPDEAVATGMRLAFLYTKAILRGMIRRRFGRIVVVAPSDTASGVRREAIAGGLIGLMKSVAREVGSRGITANVVVPGKVPADGGSVSPYTAVSRPVQMSDIRAAMAYVVADDAEYFTGQVIHLDGGLT